MAKSWGSDWHGLASIKIADNKLNRVKDPIYIAFKLPNAYIYG